MWLPLVGLFLGIAIGLWLPFLIPAIYAKYTAMALLATLDTILGGLRAGLEEKFDQVIFFSGFFVNAFIAMLLAFIGEKLGIDLYLGGVVVFSMRIFQNLSIIRRILLGKDKPN